MKKQFLEVGKITKAQGIKGEMRMLLYCDGAETLEDLDTLYLGRGEKPVELLSSRALKDGVAVIRLGGVNSPEEVQKYIGKTLYMNRDDLELPEDVWFIDDIIGLSVVDADSGRVYGAIDDVLQNSSTDVYSLRTPEGKQYLFPAIPEVLLKTDIDGGKLFIRPLPNLFDIYEGKSDDED